MQVYKDRFETDRIPGVERPPFTGQRPKEHGLAIAFIAGIALASAAIATFKMSSTHQSIPLELPPAIKAVPRAELVQLPLPVARAELVRLPRFHMELWQNFYGPGQHFWFRVLGRLGDTSALPQGGSIGDAYAIGTHYWVWCQPQGFKAPAWVDP